MANLISPRYVLRNLLNPIPSHVIRSYTLALAIDTTDGSAITGGPPKTQQLQLHRSRSCHLHASAKWFHPTFDDRQLLLMREMNAVARIISFDEEQIRTSYNFVATKTFFVWVNVTCHLISESMSLPLCLHESQLRHRSAPSSWVFGHKTLLWSWDQSDWAVP